MSQFPQCSCRSRRLTTLTATCYKQEPHRFGRSCTRLSTPAHIAEYPRSSHIAASLFLRHRRSESASRFCTATKAETTKKRARQIHWLFLHGHHCSACSPASRPPPTLLPCFTAIPWPLTLIASHHISLRFLLLPCRLPPWFCARYKNSSAVNDVQSLTLHIYCTENIHSFTSTITLPPPSAQQ